MEKTEMEIRTKQRGVKASIYFRADIHKRLTALVEQGAYASAVVDQCLRKSLPTVEREMKKLAAGKRTPR